jgi:hypothetical protein
MGGIQVNWARYNLWLLIKAKRQAPSEVNGKATVHTTERTDLEPPKPESTFSLQSPKMERDVELDKKLEKLGETCNEHEKLLLPGVIKPSRPLPV